MKKNLLRSLLMVITILSGVLTANAVDYISVTPTVSPRNGQNGGAIMQISVRWPGVSLKMANTDPDVSNIINPSCVSLKLNGNPISLGTSQMDGRVIVKRQKTSNEQSGGGEGERFDVLLIDLPDMAFYWSGTLDVVINEGAVTSTTGAVNPQIDLHYTINKRVEEVVWEPSRDPEGAPTVFEYGQCVIYASWPGCSDPQVNPQATTLPFYQKEDALNDDKLGNQESALPYMSIENGKVKFDFSSFAPGIYLLDLTEGYIKLGNDINEEQTYNFTILPGEPAPGYFAKALPSEKDWFDAFAVAWGTKVTEPYEISSPYAKYDVNSGKYAFTREGINKIKVTENGKEDIYILAVTIEEYQLDEHTKNYPSAQLTVTLDGFQFNVGSTYALHIPAGIVEITTPKGTVTNDEVNFSFKLKGQQKFQLPKADVSPAEGTVNSLKNVEITWPGTIGGYDLLNINQEGTEKITVTYDETELNDFTVTTVWSSEDAETPGADGDIMVIEFDKEQTANGSYLINIPADFVYVSDIDQGTLSNPQFAILYTVDYKGGDEPGDEDAVEVIFAADGRFKVVNLQGVVVLDTDNAADLMKLSKGVYVINGKKVLISK